MASRRSGGRSSRYSSGDFAVLFCIPSPGAKGREYVTVFAYGKGWLVEMGPEIAMRESVSPKEPITKTHSSSKASREFAAVAPGGTGTMNDNGASRVSVRRSDHRVAPKLRKRNTFTGRLCAIAFQLPR